MAHSKYTKPSKKDERLTKKQARIGKRIVKSTAKSKDKAYTKTTNAARYGNKKQQERVQDTNRINKYFQADKNDKRTARIKKIEAKK